LAACNRGIISRSVLLRQFVESQQLMISNAGLCEVLFARVDNYRLNALSTIIYKYILNASLVLESLKRLVNNNKKISQLLFSGGYSGVKNT